MEYLAFDYTYATGKTCDSSNNYGKGSYITYKDDGTTTTTNVIVCNAKDRAKLDYGLNYQHYQEKLNGCVAKTTCTTTTSEYKIGFKYSTGEKTVHVLTPVSTDPDRITPPGDETTNTIQDDGKRAVLSYGGCYANKGSERWYQAEWTFPGTYVKSKSLEKSYSGPTSNGQLTSKKYVDDSINNVVGNINTILATLTTPSNNS